MSPAPESAALSGLLPYPRLRLRHRSADRRRALVATVLSLPAGTVFFLLGLAIASIPSPPVARGPQEVALVPVGGPQWAQNRAIEPNAQRPISGPQKAAPPTADVQPPPPEEQKKKPEPIPGQVVDVAPTPDTDVPEDTSRVSEYNTHVEKETQAKDKTAFYKNAMPHHTTTEKPTELAGKDPSDRVQAVGDPGLGNQSKPKAGKAPGQRMEIPDVMAHEKLTLSRGPRGEMTEAPGSQGVKGNSTRLKLQTGEGEGEARQTAGNGGTHSRLNLSPSQSVLDKIAGAAANDHLEGVEEGESTYLNTREWKYAGFFNRVKQTVGEHWDPGTPLRRRDPSGQIYGSRDRRTIVSVTLDKQGGLAQVSVQTSSGVEFLDAEALEAFRRSQPFPNPPPGLLDTEGQVRFSFGFYLQMSSDGIQLFHHSEN